MVSAPQIKPSSGGATTITKDDFTSGSRHPYYAALMTVLTTDHQQITDEGWAYRLNAQGWVLYRNPVDGLWYNRQDARAIINCGRMQAAASA